MKINQEYEETKKAMIRHQIDCYIDEILHTASTTDSLDFFTIEVSNHEGKFSVNYTLKNRKKVY